MFVNVLTVVVIVRFPRLHTASNVLIVSLAAADTVTGVATPCGVVGNVIQRCVRQQGAAGAAGAAGDCMGGMGRQGGMGGQQGQQ